MTKVELYGGPFDGRQLVLPEHEPVLRVPVVPLPGTQSDTVTVARYVRVDHAFGNKISYRYQGDEEL